jgi:hypothetical protein
MATRTITSPGVEIRERDLSLRIPQNIGTNVFLAGFANQGPTDEVIKISTRDELEQIYGTPTNSSERYFYYSARELLNSPASIYTFRLPYGVDSGAGFSNAYSALVYPVKSYSGSTSTAVSGFDVTLNYSSLLSASVLSGAAFKFQDSTGASKTVVYRIGSDLPIRAGDIVVSVVATDNFSSIIQKTTQTINLSAPGMTFVPAAGTPGVTNSFKIALPNYSTYTVTAAASASVLPGLEDEGDIFTISPNLSSVFSGAGLTSNLDITSCFSFILANVGINVLIPHPSSQGSVMLTEASDRLAVTM